jgi:hypothetical protein
VSISLCRVYAEFTQSLRIVYAYVMPVYAMFTQWQFIFSLRRVYAGFTQSLRKFYAVPVHEVSCVNLCKGFYRFTQGLRSFSLVYAYSAYHCVNLNMFTQSLRKFTQVKRVYAEGRLLMVLDLNHNRLLSPGVPGRCPD